MTGFRLYLILALCSVLVSGFTVTKPLASRTRAMKGGSMTALSYANGDDKEVLPFLLKPLDLNNDGKLDQKDLQVFQNSLFNALDVNCDGELNEKDLYHAAKFVALFWLLSLSPAAAKGGGRGGGGGHVGGGGHASHSSFSSGRSSSSYSYHSGSTYSYYGGHTSSAVDVKSPTYDRQLFGRNFKYYKPFDPSACSDLPGEGEKVDTSLPDGTNHKPGVVQEVNEKTCTFEVAYPNELNRVPFSTEKNWELWVSGTISGIFLAPLWLPCVGVLYVAACDDWDSDVDRQFDAELKEELRSLESREDTDSSDLRTPFDGRYAGWTRESDGAKQLISVDLEFDEDTNVVAGQGKDSDDGKYVVEGEWAGDKVKWFESYEEGFVVAVRGIVSEDRRSIKCRFLSSRSIRGTFELRRVYKAW